MTRFVKEKHKNGHSHWQ